jgi:hypothetical protein
VTALPACLLVDVMNVVGSRPDGWWRDRAGAVRRLVDDLGRLAAAEGGQVVAVVDGGPLPGLPEPGGEALPAEGSVGAVTVRYAERAGPDAADDRIVALLGAVPHPERWTVVTADRALRERVTAVGADVLGPSALLDRLGR